jgi:hypothetical protein
LFSAAKSWRDLIDDLERRGVGAKAAYTLPSGTIALVEHVGRRRICGAP